MDLYVTDERFRPLAVVDDYHSFIWTDRYYAYGDAELSLHRTSKQSPLLRPGHHLTMDNSTSQMVIESVEETAQTGILKVKGRSTESLLERRLNFGAFDNVEPITQSASGAMQQSFEQNILRAGGFLNTINGNHYLPWGGGPEGRRQKTARNAYDEISSIGEEANVGWKFRYRPEYIKADVTYIDKLVFETSMGIDRSASSGAQHSVIFDVGLDNITDMSTLWSTERYKNDVWAKTFGDEAAATNPIERLHSYSDTSYYRSEIREMVMEFDPALYTGRGVDYIYRMRRGMARAELVNHPIDHYIDGRLLSGGPYRYGFHYGLGDKVTIGQDPATSRNARIIEYIWSYDETGVTEYPTFKVVTE